MSAQIEPRPEGGWQAYCPQHEDGINAGKVKCQKWADAHNSKHHSEPGENNDH